MRKANQLSGVPIDAYGLDKTVVWIPPSLCLKGYGLDTALTLFKGLVTIVHPCLTIYFP